MAKRYRIALGCNILGVQGDSEIFHSSFVLVLDRKAKNRPLAAKLGALFDLSNLTN